MFSNLNFISLYLLLAMLRRHLLLLGMLLCRGSSGPGGGCLRLRIIGLCRRQNGKSKA